MRGRQESRGRKKNESQFTFVIFTGGLKCPPLITGIKWRKSKAVSI